MLIIVNGTPSSGKTSASREFIEIIDDLFVYASYDNFKEMLPQKYSSINPSDGFYVKKYSTNLSTVKLVRTFRQYSLSYLI